MSGVPNAEGLKPRFIKLFFQYVAHTTVLLSSFSASDPHAV
jgi:hypothetical protein